MSPTASQVRLGSACSFLHSNSPSDYAVPFDEDEKDKSVWFLDHDYLENMSAMFKKVNGKPTRLNCDSYFTISNQ